MPSLGSRQYAVRRPEQGGPLLVALHWRTGNAEEMLSTLQQPALTTMSNAAMVAPQGMGASFNGLEACCAPALTMGVDDVRFVRDLVALLMANRTDHRVYMLGYSNGAFLASQIALRNLLPGLAKVVLLSGGAYDSSVYGNATAAHITMDILIMHGVRDSGVGFNGCCTAHTCCCSISSPECVSVPDVFNRWQRINGCIEGVNVTTSSSADYTCYDGVGCRAQTRLCVFPRGTHHLFFDSPPLALLFAQDFFFNDTLRVPTTASITPAPTLFPVSSQAPSSSIPTSTSHPTRSTRAFSPRPTPGLSPSSSSPATLTPSQLPSTSSSAVWIVVIVGCLVVLAVMYFRRWRSRRYDVLRTMG